MLVRRAALLVTLAGACSSSSTAPTRVDAAVDAATAAAPAAHVVAFAHQTIRDVDVLFVVDDAPGMAVPQQRLRASFAAFTDTLKDLPAGYPNLHVAIISSDLGAGPEEDPGCRVGGDKGVFRGVPRGACAATGLPTGRAFFTIEGGKTNFAPTLGLADALACVTVQDDAGCPFPHPLAAVLRALGADGMPAPPENAGFLRPGAFLAIVLVTNQDDCSARPDSSLFDPTSRYVDDPLGPLTSFRCAAFGITCGGQAVSRTTAETLTGCQSSEDGTLLRVSDVVARMKALKTDPNRILVAALAGPPDPFTVELDPPGLPEDPHPWPALSPSCVSADGAVTARPGVRVEQWVYAFGHNGVLGKTCDDVATSLRAVAQSIAGVLGPPCLAGPFAQTTGPRGPRPACTIVDYGAGPDAGAGTAVPSCVDTGGVAPCWTLTDDAGCPNAELLGFMAPAGFGANASVQCLVCDDAHDPRCR